MRFPKIGGTSLGVSMKRIMVFGGLHWGLFFYWCLGCVTCRSLGTHPIRVVVVGCPTGDPPRGERC